MQKHPCNFIIKIISVDISQTFLLRWYNSYLAINSIFYGIWWIFLESCQYIVQSKPVWSHVQLEKIRKLCFVI